MSTMNYSASLRIDETPAQFEVRTYDDGTIQVVVRLVPYDTFYLYAEDWDQLTAFTRGLHMAVLGARPAVWSEEALSLLLDDVLGEPVEWVAVEPPEDYGDEDDGEPDVDDEYPRDDEAPEGVSQEAFDRWRAAAIEAFARWRANPLGGLREYVEPVR